MIARARSTDPETSHEAAASVSDIRLSQADVLRVLWRYGPLTDEELVEIYIAGSVPGRQYRPQTPSSIRSRRAELVRLGLVEYTGEKRPSMTGRMARIWRAKN